MRRGEAETVSGEERAKGSTWQLGEENVKCLESLWSPRLFGMQLIKEETIFQSLSMQHSRILLV